MNTIESLWREHLRAAYGAALPPETQVAAQRHAFFTGAWCQLVFSRKIRDLDPVSARTVNDAIELELARELCAPHSNVELAVASRLAA